MTRGRESRRKPGSVLSHRRQTMRRAVIYLGRLLPNASSGSPTSEPVKDQPSFRRPCTHSGFTEPVPLDTAGALLPHLCTLTGISRRLSVEVIPAVCFCGTLLTLARTGRYPASSVFRVPGLSSNWLKRSSASSQLPHRLSLFLV